jgi:hypothetical protein
MPWPAARPFAGSWSARPESRRPAMAVRQSSAPDRRTIPSQAATGARCAAGSETSQETVPRPRTSATNMLSAAFSSARSSMFGVSPGRIVVTPNGTVTYDVLHIMPNNAGAVPGRKADEKKPADLHRRAFDPISSTVQSILRDPGTSAVVPESDGITWREDFLRWSCRACCRPWLRTKASGLR